MVSTSSRRLRGDRRWKDYMPGGLWVRGGGPTRGRAPGARPGDGLAATLPRLRLSVLGGSGGLVRREARVLLEATTISAGDLGADGCHARIDITAVAPGPDRFRNLRRRLGPAVAPCVDGHGKFCNSDRSFETRLQPYPLNAHHLPRPPVCASPTTRVGLGKVPWSNLHEADTASEPASVCRHRHEPWATG